MTADTAGGATLIVSAWCASSSRLLPSAAGARTIQTLAGRRCSKSSRRRGLSAAVALSPSNCCIRRSSCVGLRSPSSMALKSCCNHRCCGRQVRCLSCCLSVVQVVGYVEDKVSHSRGVLRRQGRYHIGFLSSDSTCAELCLYLGKPNVGVGGPERRYGCCSSVVDRHCFVCSCHGHQCRDTVSTRR